MKLRFAIALTLVIPFAARRAAEPTHPLDFVPPTAAYYYHFEVAELYDAHLGSAIKDSKSPELERWAKGLSEWSHIPLEQLKSYTYIVPEQPANTSKSIEIFVARKNYDRPALIKHLEAQAKDRRYEFAIKDNVFTEKSKGQFARTKLYDFRAEDRYTILEDLDESHFAAPKFEMGLHTEQLKSQKGYAFSVGMNFEAFPDSMRDEKSLPPEMKIALPLFNSKGAWFVGAAKKDRLDGMLTVLGQSKANAEAVAQGIEKGKPVVQNLIDGVKKAAVADQENPKPVLALLDLFGKSIQDAKVSQSDATVAAMISMPLKDSLAPLLVMYAGGGRGDANVITNNLKQLGVAMHNYDSANRKLPSPNTNGANGKAHSWRVQLLPYVEQFPLYKQFKLDEPWDSEHNLKVVKDNPMPEIFALPGTKNLADKATHFQVFVGKGAYFESGEPTRYLSATDGTFNTAMVALAEKAVPWTKPDDIEFDPKGKMMAKLWFDKKDRSFAVFADGHVDIIKKTMKDDVLKALITRNGGEIVDEKDR